jgi:hypothetical protein
VSYVTADIRLGVYAGAMPYVTQAQLAEIVPELRAMAIGEASAEVRVALNRLADRYTAMAAACRNPARVTMVHEFAE